MKTRDEVIKCLKENKEQLSRKYPLKAIALFGSYAREQQTEESDIDILVEFSEPVGIEFIDLALELDQIFNQRIDLVSKKGVKPHYLPYIEDDAIYV